MKDYSKWMSPNSDSEEILFDLCEKSKVKINDFTAGAVSYEAVINDANEWQKDVDLIILIKKSEYNIHCGDYIQANNQCFLVLFSPEDRNFFWSVKVRKCHSLIRWLNETGSIKEIPFLLDNVINSLGIEMGRVVNLPDEERRILIQRNSDTLKFAKSKRFIFDNRGWKITAIDGLSRENIIVITLLEDTINTYIDNVDECIANFKNEKTSKPGI
ncbi:hypothetical protein PC41400_08055 [Paenibacillus chitinolyticus]|uniref:Uncharacterized protein n=1 Tax=Paenibacillus chitinolyticus TaxID=79263 RepID=A0A410WT93_9BACL|nr:hypothetical protein [Paenibacillus chitinolyticus]MCY9594034.1 hypothetical protein [Paenibacillus chitinolyticus]MCY9599139.1 hypothetical protein [Paenibacillus chitinolyticus]QAV17619.1 hypothetical protein PC41400_08055 [Paenibacillus chitinolyticus]